MKKILIIYYSKNGSTKIMSEKISRGVQSVDNVEPILRTVPEINNGGDINELAVSYTHLTLPTNREV